MNVRKFIKVCFILILTSVTFIGCGGNEGENIENNSVDVTVVDGYIKGALVEDALGVRAVEIDGAKGLYRFSSTPSYPLRASGGKIAQTNVKFDVELSATSGTVISPITTMISDNDNIIGSLGATMGGLTEEGLRSDFIESNNTHLQKLAQLFYAVLLDSAVSNSLKTRMASSSESDLERLFDKAIEDANTSSNKDDILVLLNKAKEFDGSGSIEEFMKTAKISIKIKSIIPSPVLVRFNTDGYAKDVSLSKDGLKAYVADIYGLGIIDISEPSSPHLLASLETNGSAEDVSLSEDGTKAYIADGNEGLKIIDISEPSSPHLLASFDTNGSAEDVSLSEDGTKAYIADGNEGLKIIDISEPSSPHLLASFDINGSVRDVSLANNGLRAYVAAMSSGLQIIDISKPDSPVLLGAFKADDVITQQEFGGGVSSSYPIASGVSLSKDGTKAYLAYGKSGLKIIDVSEASLPKLLGSFDSDINSVNLSDDGQRAYVTVGYSVKVIDITNPSSPSLLTSLKTDAGTSNVSLSKDGLKAYVANTTGMTPIL